MGNAPIPRSHGLPVEVAMVRQHTPLHLVIHEDGVISLQVVGDRSVVVLGLTSAGATMLISELERALHDLNRAPTVPVGPPTPRME